MNSLRAISKLAAESVYDIGTPEYRIYLAGWNDALDAAGIPWRYQPDLPNIISTPYGSRMDKGAEPVGNRR
jgi:hypothetical protein